nr:CvpA family protein [Eubacterium sp.]
MEGQVLEIIIFAIMICSIMIGANRGMLLGIFAVTQKILVLAITLGAAPVITDVLPESVKVARQGVGYAIALVASWIIIWLLSKLIKVVNDAPVVGGINRFGGALLGAVAGFLMVWCLLALLGTFQEYAICNGIIESARANSRIMWFQNLSPLPYMMDKMGYPVI